MTFCDPYIELAYNIVERAFLDATGNIEPLPNKTTYEKRIYKKAMIDDAAKWINERGGDFDYYCEALGIDAEDKRKRIGM